MAQGLIARLATLAPISLLALVTVVGCESEGAAPTPTPVPGATNIGAIERSFSIRLDENSAPGGNMHFNIRNEAEIRHEFVIFKTDLPEDQLPIMGDKVNEDSPEVDHIAEHDPFAPGTATLDVSLEPGHYVIICNLPNHYRNGMHATLNVGP